MKKHFNRSSLTTVICVIGIVVFLGALAYLQGLLKERHYEFSPKAVSTPEAAFDLKWKFRVVTNTEDNLRTSRQIALGELFKNNESLIVNFWATWCPPCIDELPSLEYLSRQLRAAKDPKVPKVVLISVDQEATDIFKLFKSLNFDLSSLCLINSNGDFAKRVGSIKFPETYWINKSGRILHKWVGPQKWLSHEVLAILKR